MATVGLCIITNEMTPELVDRLLALDPHFDQVYVQINGSRKRRYDWPDIHISHFKWSDNFADARNALLKEVKTDYWLWMDSDDILQGAESIRTVVDHMEQTGVDIMYGLYHYFVTDQGTQELQTRERIVRTSLPGKWRGAIHEVWFPDGPCTTEHTDLVQWVHTKTDFAESAVRNRKILLAEYPKDKDPRIAYYLGLNFGATKEYEEAISWFRVLIRDGGWDEERYRAWLQVFSCYFELGKYDEALQAALQATTELPDWPDAYFMLQQLYYTLDDHQKALEWFHVGRSKPNPNQGNSPATDAAYNPTVRLYQPYWLAAYSYMCIGQPAKAMAYAVEADKRNPELGKQWQKLKDEVLIAVNEEAAVNAAKVLVDYADNYEKDALAILNGLPANIRSDPRLTVERRRLIPGEQWPKGSVVFFCGPSFESWGPDTLYKGMGGSEEAVVYLARELAHSGRNVVIYNERSTPQEDNDDIMFPIYLPWTEINPNDEFDVFVAWRDPSALKDIKARLRLCDVHDILPTDVVYENLPHVDKYLFKSQFHRNLYPEVPDDKCMVIGNGIVREQFK